MHFPASLCKSCLISLTLAVFPLERRRGCKSHEFTTIPIFSDGIYKRNFDLNVTKIPRNQIFEMNLIMESRMGIGLYTV